MNSQYHIYYNKFSIIKIHFFARSWAGSCGLQPYSYWQGIKRHSDLCVQSLLTLQLVPLLSVAGSKTANCAWRDQSLVAVAVACRPRGCQFSHVLRAALPVHAVVKFPRQLQDRLLKSHGEERNDDGEYMYCRLLYYSSYCSLFGPPLTACQTPNSTTWTLSYIADGRLRHSVAWRNAPG